jgi:hypothetical protein
MAMLAVVPPAAAQQHGGEESYGSPHDMPKDDVPRPASNDAASRATELRLNGQCDKAVTILRHVVENGGSEISQFNLGMCLIDLAGQEHDMQRAASMKREAASWIVVSANAGFPQAQAEAVVLYLDGVGVAPDPVEAKKWTLLYKRNIDRSLFGLPNLKDDLANRVDAAVPAEKRAEARVRADSWTKTSAITDQ